MRRCSLTLGMCAGLAAHVATFLLHARSSSSVPGFIRLASPVQYLVSSGCADTFHGFGKKHLCSVFLSEQCISKQAGNSPRVVACPDCQIFMHPCRTGAQTHHLPCSAGYPNDATCCADPRSVWRSTPVYMSPELINSRNGAKGYDGKSVDVWASGVLLIVMMLGTFPFDHTENPDPNTSEAHLEVW